MHMCVYIYAKGGVVNNKDNFGYGNFVEKD